MKIPLLFLGFCTTISDMKFFIRLSVLLIAVCVMIVHAYAGDIFSDFMTSCNGVYTNSDELTQDTPDQDKHDNLTLIVVPVRILALPGPGIYFEEIWNGELHRTEFWSLSSNKENVIDIKIYNVTLPDNYDKISDLQTALAALTPQDIHANVDCVGIFHKLRNGYFIGGKPDCRNIVNGKYPIYAGVITYTNMIFISPLTSSEATTILPYVVDRQGDSFSVPDTPAV